MKKVILVILTILTFSILISCNTGSVKPEKQTISVTYTQDTSKVSQSEKNQALIIKNQAEIIANQENLLKNQDTIEKSVNNEYSQNTENLISESKNVSSMYMQLEQIGKYLKIQQKQIDSMIVIKMK